MADESAGMEMLRQASETDRAAHPEDFAPGYVDEQDPTIGEGWRVENLGDADWALRRLGEIEAEIAEVEAACASTIAKLEARTKAITAQLGRGVAFFRSRLEGYMNTPGTREALLKKGREKSRKLPSGLLGWKKSGGGLKVVDESALLEWAKAQPSAVPLVRVKTEPELKPIKAFAADRCLIPPGMEEVPESEALRIEADPVALATKEG